VFQIWAFSVDIFSDLNGSEPPYLSGLLASIQPNFVYTI